jgi:ABC-type uncharacterized transport system substrate-binding protein
MKRRSPFFWRSFLAVSLFSAATARGAHLSVVVDGLSPMNRRMIQALERQIGVGHDIRVHDLRSINLSDPVAKGRFLARVAGGDFVVSIGDPASRLVAEELEDLRTFFIAAGGLSGEFLGRRHVAGVLSYSPEETVRVALALFPALKRIGVLYTPGYDGVATRMSVAARVAGVSLVARRVASRSEIGPAVRELAAGTDLLWTVGDPLFSQELIFSYLLQESLSLKKPLASPLPELVRRGGLFCTVPNPDKMITSASEGLNRWLSVAGELPISERLLAAPGEGSVFINQRLVEKWGLRIPSKLRLWDERGP